MRCKKVQNELLDIVRLPAAVDKLPEPLRDHIRGCSVCQKFHRELYATQESVRSLARVRPPEAILDNYIADLRQKMNLQEAVEIKNRRAKKGKMPPVRKYSLRPAFAIALLVLIAIGTWWLGFHSSKNMEPELMATDSLDYYLQSFDEESAQNPVSSVKGLEFEWAYSQMARK